MRVRQTEDNAQTITSSLCSCSSLVSPGSMPGSRGSSRGRGGVDGGDVCALGNTRAALARGVLISLGLRETSGGVVAWGSGVTSFRVTSGVATLGAISGKVALGGVSGEAA